MQNESELIIDEYGTKRWYLNGELHREDGPAVEYSNGYKEWYLNGIRHREDGPAVVYPNGDKRWYLNGELHRTDGPAYDCVNGYKEWYLHSNEYVFENWLKLTPLPEKEKVKMRLMYAG